MKTTTSRLAAIVAALLFTTTLSAQTTFDLTVGGVQVTSANREDVLGDGNVKYDYVNKDLIIRGAFTTKSGSNIINNKIKGLTVKFMTSCTLSTNANAISTSADMSIVGTYSGVKVTISSPKLNGISVSNGAQLSIGGYDGNIDLTIDVAYRGIYGDGNSTLNINNTAKVNIPNASNGAIYGFSSIKLDNGLSVITPEGGYVSGGKIVDASGTMATSAEIGEKKYDLTIYGTEVTSANCDDILGDGVVSYDPEKNVLTINGTIRDKTIGVYNEIEGLTINVDGPSAMFIADNEMGAYGFYSTAALTIQGNNNQLIISDGIYSGKGLTIKDCNFVTKCIYCDGSELVINNSDVMASDYIRSTYGITLENCNVAMPEGATVEEYGIYNNEDFATNIVIHRGTGGGSSSNKYDVNGDGSIDTQDVLNIYDEIQKQ